jgi:hypothetical protein
LVFNAASWAGWRFVECSIERFERKRHQDVTEIKTVPYVPLSHPFIERLIGTIRRECLDRTVTFHRFAVGFETVTTRRRASPLTSTDEYTSSPELMRRVVLRSVSNAHSQGPAPF